MMPTRLTMVLYNNVFWCFYYVKKKQRMHHAKEEEGEIDSNKPPGRRFG